MRKEQVALHLYPDEIKRAKAKAKSLTISFNKYISMLIERDDKAGK